MVGERYRDLIEAADTIGRCAAAAAGLVDAEATDQYCARLRRAGFRPRPGRRGTRRSAPRPRPGLAGPARRRPGRAHPAPGGARRPAPAAPACALLPPSRVAGRFPAAPRSLPGSRPASLTSVLSRGFLSHGNAGCAAPTPVSRHRFGNRVLPCVDHLPPRLFLPAPPPPLHFPGTRPRLQRGLRPFAESRWRVATSPRALIF